MGNEQLHGYLDGGARRSLEVTVVDEREVASVPVRFPFRVGMLTKDVGAIDVYQEGRARWSMACSVGARCNRGDSVSERLRPATSADLLRVNGC